jgi:phage baseplate assembly protein W
MDAGQLFGRGIAFPPRVRDGRVTWSEGEQNVRDAIRVILETDRNERLRRPDFGGGLGRFLFEPNSVGTRRQLQDRIEKALEEWEPRAALESVDVDPDPDDPQAAIATIVYRLVATQGRERVTLSVALAG